MIDRLGWGFVEDFEFFFLLRFLDLEFVRGSGVMVVAVVVVVAMVVAVAIGPSGDCHWLCICIFVGCWVNILF